MKYKILFFSLPILLFLEQCTYDVKPALPVVPPTIVVKDTTTIKDTTVIKDTPPHSNCDSTIITYSKSIQPILIKNCYHCHTDTSTNPNKNTYAFFNDFKQLKAYATNTSGTNAKYTTLQARIRGIEFPGMPLGSPPLSECDIRKIEIWIKQGALQN